jgi:hypothetical protein
MLNDPREQTGIFYYFTEGGHNTLNLQSSNALKIAGGHNALKLA